MLTDWGLQLSTPFKAQSLLLGEDDHLLHGYSKLLDFVQGNKKIARGLWWVRNDMFVHTMIEAQSTDDSMM